MNNIENARRTIAMRTSWFGLRFQPRQNITIGYTVAVAALTAQ